MGTEYKIDSGESWDAAEGIEAARKRQEERAARAEAIRAQLERLDAADAEQAAEEELARMEQYLLDRQRKRELEEKHGTNRILAVSFTGWKPNVGAATMFIVKLPDARSDTYQRLQRSVTRHKEAGEAERLVDDVNELARACVQYPNPRDKEEKPMYLATLNLAPGILANLANQIGAAVAGREQAEKKG